MKYALNTTPSISCDVITPNQTTSNTTYTNQPYTHAGGTFYWDEDKCKYVKDGEEVDQPKKQTLNHGWICPACGAGMSPLATRCPCVDRANMFKVGF